MNDLTVPIKSKHQRHTGPHNRDSTKNRGFLQEKFVLWSNSKSECFHLVPFRIKMNEAS